MDIGLQDGVFSIREIEKIVEDMQEAKREAKVVPPRSEFPQSL